MFRRSKTLIHSLILIFTLSLFSGGYQNQDPYILRFVPRNPPKELANLTSRLQVLIDCARKSSIICYQQCYHVFEIIPIIKLVLVNLQYAHFSKKCRSYDATFYYKLLLTRKSLGSRNRNSIMEASLPEFSHVTGNCLCKVGIVSRNNFSPSSKRILIWGSCGTKEKIFELSC